MRPLHAAVALLGLTSLLLVHDAAGQAYLPANMLDAIDSAGILWAFKALAIEAGFGEMFLSPDFNGTVFAPSDMAFAAAGFPVPPPPPAPVDPIEAQDGPADTATAATAPRPVTPAVPAVPAVGAAAAAGPAAAPVAPGVTPGHTANSTVKSIISFHIVRKLKVFPLGTVKQGTALTTQEGHPLFIDRGTPGIIHLYGSPPNRNPSNFATVLQYQQVRGGKSILYLVDRVLKPPKT